MLIVAWMILFLFYYTYINLKKVSMKIKAKFSSISIKTCTYLLIFSVFFSPNASPTEYQIATGLSHRSQTD